MCEIKNCLILLITPIMHILYPYNLRVCDNEFGKLINWRIKCLKF